jgi:acetyltransferase
MLAHYGRFLKSYHSKANFDLNWGVKAKPAAKSVIETARAESRRYLLEPEAKKLLELHGAPVSQDQMAQNADEAVRIAESVDGAVVLKVVSPQILHKSDAGGVRIGLYGQEQVRRAYDDILANARRFDPEADIRGVLVSPMAPKGIEVIIGIKYDDQFGPVIMYGLGGIMVEILEDVSFRVLPLSPSSARKMIEETKSFPILDGVRGTPPSDKKAIRKLLLLCSEVVESYPEIAEMDLNPIIVYNEGLSIVDARIILKE